MNEMFNVTLHVNDGEGTTEIIKATVEFSYNPDTYGNGYCMGVTSKAEPFGVQGYDIRYDKDFHKDAMIPYIVSFYANKYSGKNGSWKLIGIRVHEAEEID